jgi:DNA mismatch repair protein MutS
MDQPMLRDDFNNFLVALVPSGRDVGLALVDISTGEFGCAGLDQAELLEEIARILPSEVILPPAQKQDAAFCQALTQLGVARLTTLEPDAFRPETAQGRLREHFQVASLSVVDSGVRRARRGRSAGPQDRPADRG